MTNRRLSFRTKPGRPMVDLGGVSANGRVLLIRAHVTATVHIRRSGSMSSKRPKANQGGGDSGTKALDAIDFTTHILPQRSSALGATGIVDVSPVRCRSEDRLIAPYSQSPAACEDVL